VRPRPPPPPPPAAPGAGPSTTPWPPSGARPDSRSEPLGRRRCQWWWSGRAGRGWSRWSWRGLTLGLAFPHTLELPQKLDYDAATWTQLQHSLYRYFAVVGGPLEVATVLAAVVFAVWAHRL